MEPDSIFQKELLAASMNRKQFAKLIHEYIRDELNEQDEADFTAALVLKDLYDCRTCVQHIAQVYVKGIMPGISDTAFGNDLPVSNEEALLFLERAACREKRLTVNPPPDTDISYLSLDEAISLGSRNSDLIFVDVRLPEEKQVHYDLQPVVNCALREIQLNPFAVSHDILKPIVLFCNHGYLSSLAAEVMVKSGFRRIYVINRVGGGD